MRTALLFARLRCARLRCAGLSCAGLDYQLQRAARPSRACPRAWGQWPRPRRCRKPRRAQRRTGCLQRRRQARRERRLLRQAGGSDGLTEVDGAADEAPGAATEGLTTICGDWAEDRARRSGWGPLRPL